MASHTNINSGETAADPAFAADAKDERTLDEDAWSKIFKIIRDVDGERVQDYREDIDNILVFAGLYSAVLTAFLVDSYKQLQQDPQDTMIFLLQQVVLQTNSFVINDRFINSTLPHPNLVPAFVPTLNAQRVNGLWFTSLVLSLISASFCIIVKQWLRQFLSIGQSSPRAHLRVRHFRTKGITKYWVFEIAAFLPLLLQISLLFFFIGLCLFTTNIHKSIGNTTVTLVTAWGFLFLATIFVPAFDPACPYKFPALRILAKAFGGWLLRVRLPRFRSRGGGEEGPRGAAGEDNSESNLIAPGPEESGIALAHAERASQAQDGQHVTYGQDEASRTHEERTDPGATDGATAGAQALGRCAPYKGSMSGEGKSTTSGARYTVRDEEQVARDKDGDAAVLIDILKVDAVQANPQLLRNIMQEALLQPSLQLQDLYDLHFSVIDHNLKPGEVEQLQVGFIDMTLSLSRQTYETITYVLAQLVEQAMKDDTIFAQIGTAHQNRSNLLVARLEDSICTLLSDYKFPHSSKVDEILYACLAQDRYHSLCRLIKSRISSQANPSLKPVLGRLQGGLAREKDTSKLLDILESVLHQLTSNPVPATQVRDTQDSALSGNQSNDVARAIPGPQATIKCPDDCKPLLKTLLSSRIKINKNINDAHIQVLTRIDAILLDDHLLAGPIRAALQEANAVQPAHIFKFMIAAMSRRVDYKFDEVSSTFLDLASLDGTVYTTIMELAAQCATTEIGKLPGVSPSLQSATSAAPSYDNQLGDIICLLLSPGAGHHDDLNRSETVNQALRNSLSEGYCIRTANLIRSRSSLLKGQPETQSESSRSSDAELLRRVLKRLEGGFALVDDELPLIYFIRHLFQSPSNLETPGVKLVFTAGSDIIPCNIPDCYREHVVDLFLSKLSRRADAKEQEDSRRSLLLEGIFQLCEEITGSPWKSKVIDFVKQSLASSNSAVESSQSQDFEVICDFALNTTSRPRSIMETAQGSILEAAKDHFQSNSDGLIRILAILNENRERRARQPSHPLEQPIDADSLFACRFYLQLLIGLPPRFHNISHHLSWKQLFYSVIPSLKKHSVYPKALLSRLPRKTVVRVVTQCLELISTIRHTFIQQNLKLPFRTSEMIGLLAKIRENSAEGA